MGQRKRSSEIRGKGKKAGARKISQVDKDIWKKQSERIPTRKLWDHIMDIKERFVPRKRKVYLLSREKREEVREFIKE